MSKKKPNVLIIMADQMTAALTGAYGHPVVKTPALDRLCREGVRFDSAYSNCPICTPARAAMLSGRYVSRTRTYDNGAILPCDVPTYAHHLRLAGYEVAVSGKMHLVGADQLHGFEHRLTPDIYPTGFAWTPSWDGYTDKGIVNDKGHMVEEKWIGVREWSHQLNYDTDVQNQAIEFLRTRGDSENEESRPFCLLVSFTHPHPPYLITQEFWDMYEDAEIDMPNVSEDVMSCRSQMDRWLYEYEGVSEEALRDKERMYTLRRTYYGMVSYVDAQVAELVNTLEQNGLDHNTAIIFTSDHGDMLCDRQLIEKRTFYEWSCRIPLIASFPDQWATDAACSVPVSLVDLFPTLTEFTGASKPVDVDGTSFLELLQQPDQDQNRIVYSEYHCEGVKAPCFMARKGTMKYVYIHGADPQLFDLSTDPREVCDLAGDPKFRAIEDELREEILNRFDPAAIADDVIRSQAERILMHRAMNEGQPTKWGKTVFPGET